MQPNQIKYRKTMGKNNLILGTARGKLGDVVFYRTGGEQRFRTRVRPTNPRTNAQLLQRCVVSTAVKFYSQVVEVCNHAFQNYEGSLKNHQRFMKLNIDYLRKIALKNIETWSPIKFTTQNYGNFTWKDSMDVAINQYQISEGDLTGVETTLTQHEGQNAIMLGTMLNSNYGTATYDEVAEALGVNLGDQITMFLFECYPDTGYIKNTLYGRTIISPNSGIGTEKFFNNPNKENTGDVQLSIPNWGEENTGKIVLRNTITKSAYIDETITAWAIIVSRFENGKWRRSTSYVQAEDALLNKQTLLSAMISYEKDETSSLYLNQANNGSESQNSWTDVRPRTINEENEEIEVKTRKTKKTAE